MQDWLCFSLLTGRKNPLIILLSKNLRLFCLWSNWLCFAKKGELYSLFSAHSHKDANFPFDIYPTCFLTDSYIHFLIYSLTHIIFNFSYILYKYYIKNASKIRILEGNGIDLELDTRCYVLHHKVSHGKIPDTQLSLV